MLSVGELHAKGYQVTLGNETFLQAGDYCVPLQRVGSMVYLEVDVLPSNIIEVLSSVAKLR
eukprot:849288-Heterocapsa_arctica.AAC.1